MSGVADMMTGRLAEASQLLAVVDWAAHKLYADILKGALVKLEAFDVELEAGIRSRIEFFGVRLAAINLVAGNDEMLEAVLAMYDELMGKWQVKAEEQGLPELQWLTIRYKIIMQMGISILRKHLKIEGAEAFVRPDTIPLPSQFNMELYEKELTNLFSTTKYYGAVNTVAAKTEKTCAGLTRSSLVDIISGPKNQPFKYKIFFLFNCNTITSLSREINIFFEEIEGKVLPVPELVGESSLATRAALVLDVHSRTSAKNPDWTIEQRAVSGPYTGVSSSEVPPTSTPSKALPTAHQSSSKSPAAALISPPNNEPEPKRSKVGRPKKKVSESFTQLTDDEQTDIPVEEHAPTQSNNSHALRTQSSNDIVTELEKARKEFSKTMEKNDPLMDALASAPPAVVSSAVRFTRGTMSRIPEVDIKAEQASPEKKKSIESEQPPTRGVKRAITETRDSAEQVQFSTSSDSDDFETKATTATSTAKHSRHSLLNVEKVKFPKTIHAEKPSFSYGPKHRTAWNQEEEQGLIRGIIKYGVGMWKEILADVEIGPLFRQRTNVQLKDKYRNMLNQGYKF